MDANIRGDKRRRKWLDAVEEDLRKLDIGDWRVQERIRIDRWRGIIQRA